MTAITLKGPQVGNKGTHSLRGPPTKTRSGTRGLRGGSCKQVTLIIRSGGVGVGVGGLFLKIPPAQLNEQSKLKKIRKTHFLHTYICEQRFIKLKSHLCIDLTGCFKKNNLGLSEKI